MASLIVAASLTVSVSAPVRAIGRLLPVSVRALPRIVALALLPNVTLLPSVVAPAARMVPLLTVSVPVPSGAVLDTLRVPPLRLTAALPNPNDALAVLSSNVPPPLTLKVLALAPLLPMTFGVGPLDALLTLNVPPLMLAISVEATVSGAWIKSTPELPATVPAVMMALAPKPVLLSVRTLAPLAAMVMLLALPKSISPTVMLALTV